MDKIKINRVAQEQEFSGVVYVERKGEVVFEEAYGYAYGYADRVNLLANQIDNRFSEYFTT